MATTSPLTQALRLVKVDFKPTHRQPSWALWVVASIVAVVGSLVADWLIVKLWVAIWPHTQYYPHFQFADYSKLTVIGVVGACIGWPIVTRISSAPRWLFFWLAIVVTLVLFVPDFYILWFKNSPLKDVLGLLAMHVAIALVTYNSLVRIAPIGATTSKR